MRASKRFNRGSSFRRMAGFTLIEMLIVIGVILLLTAITVTVVTGLSSRAEIRDAENTMRLMENALSEWELGNSRQVTYGIDGEPCDNQERYEIQQTVTEVELSDILWSILSRTSSSREIIARVRPDYLTELDPNPSSGPVDDLDHLNDRISYRFVDPWGTVILAILPGRSYQHETAACAEDTAYCVEDLPDSCPDEDGTIRTPFENRFGVAASGRIYFVSAGPDGQFGDLHLATAWDNLSAKDKEDIVLAADNIYSREIIIEEGRPKP